MLGLCLVTRGHISVSLVTKGAVSGNRGDCRSEGRRFESHHSARQTCVFRMMTPYTIDIWKIKLLGHRNYYF